MKYDGKRYVRAPAVVLLWDMVVKGDENYGVFGRVVPLGKKPPKNAIEVHGRHWNNPDVPNGTKVYAVPIKVITYTATNVACGADGREYMCRDGICYSRPYRIPETWKTSPLKTIITRDQAHKERMVQVEEVNLERKTSNS